MSERKEDLSQHILSTSAQLLGVCITVISLIKVLRIGRVGSLLDELLAIDALLFTVSATLSYASIRRRGARSVNLERYADRFFILGLLELGACAILLSLEII